MVEWGGLENRCARKSTQGSNPCLSANNNRKQNIMNLLLFISTVMIWGATWIAIALQVGEVPLIVSVFYRFAIAAVIFIAILAILKKLEFPAIQHHPYIFIQAICLFSMNFVLFYYSVLYIPSGLVAIIFSLATIYNAINAKIFFGENISTKTIVAGILGLIGLAIIFLPNALSEINENNIMSETLVGVALAMLGTLLFSLGNMASRRNTEYNLPITSTNAWGMAYGVIIGSSSFLVRLSNDQFRSYETAMRCLP